MTNPNIPNLPPPVPTEAVVEELRAQLEAQPWYRRFANTVTAAAGLLSLLIWTLIANGVEIPGEVGTAIGSALGLLTLLGLLKTPNGITPRGVERVEDAASKAAERY
ncbi:hypothetical protein SEA_WHOSEMANZ_50 [Gordonia phage WhoseManz]|nr:hypothetical protein SEA_WHOSEMANZ_50 [Gordonia phage WhoseManz]